MKKEQIQTQVWIEQSCQEARRGPPQPPAHSLCCSQGHPLGRKGGQREQKWTLGPGYQHAEVHSDPWDR